MAINPQYRDFILQQLEPVGHVLGKNMFGGVGVYHQTKFFAIIFNDALYFKVDATNRADYEAEGMAPFKPFAHRPMTMQYYEVPIHVIEDSSLLVKWARKAIAVASQSPSKQTRSAPKKSAKQKTHVRK